MLRRTLSFVRAVRGRALLCTMTGGEATPSSRRRSSRRAGERLSEGPRGEGWDWMLWAAMGLALLTTLVGLVSSFLP
jgi:hypothetical protein